MHIKRLCVGWGVSMVPVGVWMMPRLCLRGRHQYQTSWEIDILSYDTQILPFLPVPVIAYKCLCAGVSGLCLGVSGWGLRMSRDVLAPNMLAQTHIGLVS